MSYTFKSKELNIIWYFKTAKVILCNTDLFSEVKNLNNGLHRHGFEGTTSVDEMHSHNYSGTTSTDPDMPGHSHFMSGTTSFSNGHTHRFEVRTSPEIPVGNGGHTHYYRGMTTYNGGHAHYFEGYTTIY